MKNKLASVCMAILLMFAMPLMVSAQSFNPNGQGSLAITVQDQGKPIKGVELSLYHVAIVELNENNNLIYTFNSEYKPCGVKIDDPSLASVLDTFVEQNAVTATKIVTGEEGKAVICDVPQGLYFVKQTNSVAGYAPCTSFLVKVPYKDGDNFEYDVQASPKTDIQRLTSITIKKVWNTDESTKTADNVTVHLLKDGAVIETATLSAANNWQITYNNMPESDSYSVVEINVPNGFTPTYSQNGYEFTVTNTASLIETGQLVWPVPILAMAGLVLITLGAVTLCRQEDYDE